MFENVRPLKKSKSERYSNHLDKVEEKEIAEKKRKEKFLSEIKPLKAGPAKYTPHIEAAEAHEKIKRKSTKHFRERMIQRNIDFTDVADILELGKKYYLVLDDRLEIRYFYNKTKIVEVNGCLLTVHRVDGESDMYKNPKDNFIFE